MKMQGMRVDRMWKDPSNMYMDFDVIVKVTSSNEYISSINFDYALFNYIVEVLAMKLQVSILTMDCACPGSKISTLWRNCYNRMWRWGSKQYSIWKWCTWFLLFLNEVMVDRNEYLCSLTFSLWVICNLKQTIA